MCDELSQIEVVISMKQLESAKLHVSSDRGMQRPRCSLGESAGNLNLPRKGTEALTERGLTRIFPHVELSELSPF